MPQNKQVLLDNRPEGEATAANFRLATTDTPPLQEGQVLVRHHFLSLDPYMRGRMNDAKSYAQPQALGQLHPQHGERYRDAAARAQHGVGDGAEPDGPQAGDQDDVSAGHTSALERTERRTQRAHPADRDRRRARPPQTARARRPPVG